MAPVTTPDVSTVTLQDLHNAGLNPFAVQLLVESYAAPHRGAPDALVPLSFVWRGVTVSLSVYEVPR